MVAILNRFEEPRNSDSPQRERYLEGFQKHPEAGLRWRESTTRPQSASAAGRMLEASDQATALPKLAIVPVHARLRDLNRGLVIVRFDPQTGRYLVDAVEPIKSVVCHVSKSKNLVPPGGQFCPRNEIRDLWFQWPFSAPGSATSLSVTNGDRGHQLRGRRDPPQGQLSPATRGM
jgi:hypothetical protein